MNELVKWLLFTKGLQKHYSFPPFTHTTRCHVTAVVDTLKNTQYVKSGKLYVN